MPAVAAVRAFVSFNAMLDGTRMGETLPFASYAASSGVVLNAVTQLNHPILKTFDGG